MAMRRWPHDQKSKSKVNSHDVIKWKYEAYVRRSQWLYQILEPNLAQNTNTTLSTRMDGQIHITWKSKMAAAAIFNFGKRSITLDWIKTLHQILWEDASQPCGDDHVTRSRNRNERLKHMCVLISVSVTDIWTKFDIELKHHTINMTECGKFTWFENPIWRPPSWISENVNNFELDRAICTKFGGQMHHGHAEMTHDQNSKSDVYSRDVIKRMSGT